MNRGLEGPAEQRRRRSRGALPAPAALALCALSLLLPGNLDQAFATPPRPEPSARFLIIALDAVPFQAAVDLTRPADGKLPLLDDFAGPAPLISTFPSNTSVALTAILERFGLELPPGYEVKFYDHEAAKIRGGGLIAYKRIRFDWHHFFDWQLQGFFSKSFAYARPMHYGVKEVDRALDAFSQTDKRVFFVYVNATDAIGHIAGPEGLRQTFENLDQRIDAVRAASAVPVYTVVFSDHGLGGGVLLENAREAVVEALEQAGWRSSKTLRGPGDVVLTPFGLVSSFEVYTIVGEEGRVAEAIVRAPGVGLCAYRSNSTWIVLDHHGRASFERREGVDGPEWSYTVETADPLRLEAVMARLRTDDPDTRWFPESSWFEQSWDERYPDPLFRIASGFERVRNPASILCSVSNGYLYGSKSAFVGSKMSVGSVRWTHGALLRGETTGFLMTDFPGWKEPPALRFDQALDFLADHLFAETDR
jgi:hypothetical protein